jgi:hypothetical protein
MEGHAVARTVIPVGGPLVEKACGVGAGNDQENQEVVAKCHGLSPSGNRPLREAGEGGRTLDIHVGNVTLYH